MTTAPAWQLYGRDFESETAMLSCAEVGAHVRCLCWSWPNGPLPGDLRALASIMRARTPREAATMWTQIAPLWTATAGGFVNSGLEAQRQKHATYRALQVTKGKASAAARASARIAGPQPAHQPAANRTSTTVEPRYQPEANSSICDLQTSVKDQDQNHRASIGRALSAVPPSLAVVPLGWQSPDSLVGHHSRCPEGTWAACARGKCVPGRLFAEWRAQLTDQEPTAYIRAFVERVVTSIPAGPIGATGWDFWGGHWRAAHPAMVPAAPAHGKGNQSAQSMQRALTKLTAGGDL